MITRLIIVLWVFIMLLSPIQVAGEKENITPIPEPPVIVVTPPTPREYIEEVFGVGHIMMHIADAESHVCINNVNPISSARGCFQILKSTWRDAACLGDVLNYIDNINCAKILYDDSGTTPWNPSRGEWGKYVTPKPLSSVKSSSN